MSRNYSGKYITTVWRLSCSAAGSDILQVNASVTGFFSSKMMVLCAQVHHPILIHEPFSALVMSTLITSGAAMHFMKVFEEAKARYELSSTVGIRVSYGFDGLLLRCSDIPWLLDLPYTLQPVDVAYGNYWSSKGGKMHTYRYKQPTAHILLSFSKWCRDA